MANRKRNRVLSVRLTPEEWEELEARAIKDGMALSRYVRHAALERASTSLLVDRLHTITVGSAASVAYDPRYPNTTTNAMGA